MFDFLPTHPIPERTHCDNVPTSAGTSCSNSLDHGLEIEEEFALTVLGEGERRRVSGRIAQLVGRRLVAQVSEYLKPETCVRIDFNDAFVLGVAVASWREGPATLVALELHQVLHRLAWWESQQPLKTHVRSRAQVLKSEIQNASNLQRTEVNAA